MKRQLGKLLHDITGATAVEYGLIAALIVMGLMGGLVALAGASTDLWSNVSAQVQAAH